jgi:hypothetical protein
MKKIWQIHPYRFDFVGCIPNSALWEELLINAKLNKKVGFEVITAVVMKSSVSCDIMPWVS